MDLQNALSILSLEFSKYLQVNVKQNVLSFNFRYNRGKNIKYSDERLPIKINLTELKIEIDLVLKNFKNSLIIFNIEEPDTSTF
jgi:hypothetical protein